MRSFCVFRVLRLVVVLAATVLLWSVTAVAQYRFDHWTTDNGLPQNTVRQILQTSDGYLWFTTLDGLVRFDGVRFKVYNKSNSKNLPSNRFINLFSEPDDTLWISTEEHGVLRFRGGEFRSFTMADGLPSNQVFEVFRDSDGSPSAISREGLAKFDGVRFTSVLNYEEATKFKRLYAPSGNFWEVNQTNVTLVKNGQKNTYEFSEELKKDFQTEPNFFLAARLFEDRKGDLWFSFNSLDFRTGRLFKFSNGDLEEISAEQMPRSLVHTISEDGAGNIWLTTAKDGVCRLSENRFACYGPENGFPSRACYGVFEDGEGTLWVTTEDKGIFRLSEQIITPLSTEKGLSAKNVYPILETESGAVWIGSIDGLARYEDGKFTNYKVEDGLRHDDVQSLFEDQNGRLWIGTVNGVMYFENGRFYEFNDKFPNSTVNLVIHDIHQDRTGNLWFASSLGLYKYDGSSIVLLTTADGLPGNNVKTIVENDDGSFWLGTYSGISLFKDGRFTNYTAENGLAGNHVRALYKDETGTLWIGTYDSGLSRFKDGKFTNYTMETGLASNGAFQILADAGRNFWMTSNQGIYRVSREHLEEFAEGKRQIVPSTLFGKTDGMLNTEANGGGQPAGIKTKDGRLWFPTQDGVAIVNTEKVKLNPLPPPVVIEEARIDNQKVEALKTEIKLNPGQENLEIDYTGLSFVKSEQMQFRYRLEGLEDTWTEAKNRRTAFYPHVTPGEYTFRVIAANSDNVWNEQGATIKVVVLPPFYQTWLFMLLVGVAVAVFVYWVYKMRLREIKLKHAAQEEFSRRLIAAHELERRRVAAELHDSLGQTLAMIKNRAVFAHKNADDVQKAKEEFDRITEQSVDAINEVREISYNLRPYLLDRLGLTKALKSLINKTSENTHIKIKAEIDNIDGLFTSDEEMSFYRIVQESLNNIIKHAAAKNVEVDINRSGNVLSAKIQDDGCGFLTSGNSHRDKKGGFGLLGMSERVKILGGTHNIISAIGKGTCVDIKIDISERNRVTTDGESN